MIVEYHIVLTKEQDDKIQDRSMFYQCDLDYLQEKIEQMIDSWDDEEVSFF